MKKLFIFVLCTLLIIPLFVSAQTLGQRLSGKLLLQVEQGGRIWYISPNDTKRYEVTFENALSLFEQQALGITDANLAKIPIAVNSLSNETDSDNDGYTDYNEAKAGFNPFGPGKATGTVTFGKRFSGKLMLQVEQGGRIWYIDFDGYRWEVTWENLMNLFRRLSLGITNKDLETIPTATVYNNSQIEQNQNTTEEESSTYIEDNTTINQSNNNQNTHITNNTSVTTQKPGLLQILENFDALSGSQMAQIYNSLSQDDILLLSIYEAFGGLMHYKMCTEVPNQYYQSASRGLQDCNTTIQILQNTLQFISLDSLLQNAENERLTILNARNCASGTTDAATCSMYANASQNLTNMQGETFQRVNMNLNNECYVGVDAGCEYYNTY